MEEKNHNMGQQSLRERVLDDDLCTGCGACVNLCPYQKAFKDNTITLFPCDLKEGRCYAFCPRCPTDLEGLRANLFDKADLTPEVGAIKEFYITRSADPDLRKNAQHGGTVTTLIKLALAEGIIDGAVVSEHNGLLPHGIMVQDANETDRFSKSNLVVSPNVAEFNRVAAGNGAEKIGVVATPCQALALAKMRMKPMADNSSNIDKLALVVGVFCGWAFSWKKLSALLEQKTDLENIVGMDIPPSKYNCLEVYTNNGTININLDEVVSCVRPGCHYCFDMTGEFSDISVGSARLEEGWDVAKGWNQVIVRTSLGDDLLGLARKKGVLEFRKVPSGNLDKLKKASMNKKKTAVENLIRKSGSPDDLLYLDRNDPVLSRLLG